jgi:Sporulation and spore germination
MPGAPIFRLSEVPRYQRVLFFVFLGAIALMAADLFRLRHVEQTRLSATLEDAQQIPAATVPLVAVRLFIANDAVDAITPRAENIVLPKSPNAAARTLLLALVAESSKPNSSHPLPANASVDDVFLLPLDANLPSNPNQQQLAVVNLNSTFAHQSGATLASETLTLHSILATLQANLPQIQAARFLIDGRQSDTLAGHADLRRTYSTTAPYAPLPAPKLPVKPAKVVAQP